MLRACRYHTSKKPWRVGQGSGGFSSEDFRFQDRFCQKVEWTEESTRRNAWDYQERWRDLSLGRGIHEVEQWRPVTLGRTEKRTTGNASGVQSGWWPCCLLYSGGGFSMEVLWDTEGTSPGYFLLLPFLGRLSLLPVPQQYLWQLWKKGDQDTSEPSLGVSAPPLGQGEN